MNYLVEKKDNHNNKIKKLSFKNVLIVLLVLSLIFIITSYADDILSKNEKKIPQNNLESEEVVCNYNGEIYREGDSFPAEDGCNTCVCVSGNAGCTRKACQKQNSL